MTSTVAVVRITHCPCPTKDLSFRRDPTDDCSFLGAPVVECQFPGLHSYLRIVTLPIITKAMLRGSPRQPGKPEGALQQTVRQRTSTKRFTKQHLTNPHVTLRGVLGRAARQKLRIRHAAAHRRFQRLLIDAHQCRENASSSIPMS